MKHSVYSTLTSNLTMNTKDLASIIEFLITNQNDIVVPRDKAKKILSLRSVGQSPIARIFLRAAELDKSSAFTLINIPDRISSYPEAITFNHIPFDTLQMGDVLHHDIIRSLQYTEYNNRILFNITPWLTRDGEIYDVLSVQELVVRDLLSRSYFKSDKTWISPAIARFLCKVYSMLLATTVASFYNLNTVSEQKAVATVFAYYYAYQVIGDLKTAKEFVKINASYFYLGDVREVVDILTIVDNIRGSSHTFNLDHVCTAINNLGISRVNLNRRLLHERTKSWGSNVNISAMAIEYAPYWAWLLFMAKSGRKIGLSFHLKKFADIWRQLDDAVDEILRAPGFFPLI